MGAWGTSLYANDSASDIRGDYLDKLRRGQTNEEVTRALIEAYRDIMGDPEEEPLFWFALADTQWNYGRLLSEVKEKALYFLSQDTELERWKESGEKKLNAWKNTLEKLEEKLNSPQPPEKKVYNYRLYQCKWKLGDVFAYRFTSDYSKEKGFWGQYVVFREISEGIWWPGHIIPVIQIYKWIGKEIPSLDQLSKLELLSAFYTPDVFEKFPNTVIYYGLKLICGPERSIPKDNLTFLGNLPGDDLVTDKNYDHWFSNFTVRWGGGNPASFEYHIINQYLLWKDISLPTSRMLPSRP